MHARFRPSYQKRESFNIRIDAQSGELIEQAAKLVGVKRTDFILVAARRAAQDLLLDHRILTVSPKAYREFVARLDARPRPNKRLIKRMRSGHLPESAGSPAYRAGDPPKKLTPHLTLGLVVSISGGATSC